MTDETGSGRHEHPDGLWRWLLGGLAGGGAVLGLLIGAYAIGYHRGQEQTQHERAATATSPRADLDGRDHDDAARPRRDRCTVTPALVAAARRSSPATAAPPATRSTGTPGAGPSFKGLAGGTSTLTNGQTVTADDAYLERSITDPDAEIVKGYHAGIMAAAIAGLRPRARSPTTSARSSPSSSRRSSTAAPLCDHAATASVADHDRRTGMGCFRSCITSLKSVAARGERSVSADDLRDRRAVHRRARIGPASTSARSTASTRSVGCW